MAYYHDNLWTHQVHLVLTPNQSAEAIGVSRSKIYELLRSGELRSIKIGRSRRVPIEDLNQFIADLRESA